MGVSRRHGYVGQISEDRSDGFRTALAVLFINLVGDEEAVTPAERTVPLRERAAAMLDVVPSLPEE